jgi:hypothetical protein
MRDSTLIWTQRSQVGQKLLHELGMRTLGGQEQGARVTEMVEGDSEGRLPLLNLKEHDVRTLHDEGADATQSATRTKGEQPPAKKLAYLSWFLQQPTTLRDRGRRIVVL